MPMVRDFAVNHLESDISVEGAVPIRFRRYAPWVCVIRCQAGDRRERLSPIGKVRNRSVPLGALNSLSPTWCGVHSFVLCEVHCGRTLLPSLSIYHYSACCNHSLREPGRSDRNIIFSVSCDVSNNCFTQPRGPIHGAGPVKIGRLLSFLGRSKPPVDDDPSARDVGTVDVECCTARPPSVWPIADVIPTGIGLSRIRGHRSSPGGGRNGVAPNRWGDRGQKEGRPLLWLNLSKLDLLLQPCPECRLAKRGKRASPGEN